MKSIFQKSFLFMLLALCVLFDFSITASAQDIPVEDSDFPYVYLYSDYYFEMNSSVSDIKDYHVFRYLYSTIPLERFYLQKENENIAPNLEAFFYYDVTKNGVPEVEFAYKTVNDTHYNYKNGTTDNSISTSKVFKISSDSNNIFRHDVLKSLGGHEFYSLDISTPSLVGFDVRMPDWISYDSSFLLDLTNFDGMDLEEAKNRNCQVLYYVEKFLGGLTPGTGGGVPPYSEDLAVPDKSLGYLQNVIYKEENRALDGRYATLSWKVGKADWGVDYRIQIMADNFYTKWFNKTTTEYTPYKIYDDNIAYSSGEFTFFSQEPVRNWMDANGYDYKNPLKYQTYGSTNYYVRVVKYDESDGKFHCGGWTKIDIKRANSNQLPWTETETGGFDEETGGWVTDNESDDSYKYQTGGDGTITVPWNTGNLDDINLNAFTWLWRNIKNMIDGMGQFPAFVTAMFGFLPSFVITAIAGVLVVVILLRFLGR